MRICGMPVTMRRLPIADPQNVILSLQDEIRRSEESRYDHRLHAVLLVAQGMSGQHVAQVLGDAHRTVAYWVTRFEERGFLGLTNEAPPGRTPSISQTQLKETKVSCECPLRLKASRCNGTARPCLCICSGDGASHWGAGNASACFVSWAFGSESPGRRWPMPILSGRRHKNNFTSWPGIKWWIFGPSMRSDSNSTVRPVGCGYRWRSRTLSCFIIPPGTGSVILAPCASGMGSSCAVVKKSVSTPRHSSRF